MLLGVSGLATFAARETALPESVFVVHCEPTTAQEIYWNGLVQLVSTAETYLVPLTIMFTAQWAQMIHTDESKISRVEAWLAWGHEIACHHHGYWGTKERAASWDGYTNTPVTDIEEADLDSYLGPMDDYMALLEALPGKRISACFGTSEQDEVDWSGSIPYSTRGNKLEDAIGVPDALERNGCEVIEIGYGLLANQPRGAMQAAYSTCSSSETFGANGHVYNFVEFRADFDQWFEFLHRLDPTGSNRCTISGLLSASQHEEEPS